jgi:hypothetical protein
MATGANQQQLMVQDTWLQAPTKKNPSKKTQSPSQRDTLSYLKAMKPEPNIQISLLITLLQAESFNSTPAPSSDPKALNSSSFGTFDSQVINPLLLAQLCNQPLDALLLPDFNILASFDIPAIPNDSSSTRAASIHTACVVRPVRNRRQVLVAACFCRCCCLCDLCVLCIKPFSLCIPGCFCCCQTGLQVELLLLCGGQLLLQGGGGAASSGGG